MRRLATENDLEPVFSLYMNETVIPFLGFDPMPLESFGEVYRDLLDSGCFFVYEVSDEIAGFYKAARHPGRAHHVACLSSLAIAPKFHGKGIADRMVAGAIQEMKASGVQRVELIVEGDNARAIGFYRRLGFEVEGKLRKFYKRAHESHYVDDYIMALLLSPEQAPDRKISER